MRARLAVADRVKLGATVTHRIVVAALTIAIVIVVLVLIERFV